jgi:hypothetical protein
LIAVLAAWKLPMQPGMAAVDVANVEETLFAPQFREQESGPAAAAVSSQGVQDRF